MGILNTLLEISIYSGVIFLAIVIMKKVFHKRMSPLLHYGIWFLLIARLLMPVTVDSGIKLIMVPQQERTAQTVQQPIDKTLDQNISFQSETQIDDALPGGLQESTQAAQTLPQTNTLPVRKIQPVLNISDILTIVWLAGVFFSGVYILASFLLVRQRIIKNAMPGTKRLYALFEGCKNELGINKDLKLVTLRGLSTPALFFPSVVLMPEEALVTMSDTEIQYALRHELTHYKHKDHWMSILLVFLQSVYWFNPFVWLASRRIRLDMEVACDNAVVKHLNGSEKSNYANMIISMFSRTRYAQMVLGMAQGSAKKTARQRVYGIFMDSKSGKGTKAVCVMLAAVLLIACFTTACQPTPATAVVVNKNDKKLEDKIAQTASAVKKYEAPERLKDSFACKDEKVQVDVDAKVVVPDAAELPVVDIAPDDISMDFIKNAVKVLLEGKKVYEPRTVLSKPEIEKEILDLQKSLADPKNSKSDGLNADDPDIVAQTKKLFEDRIKNYKKLYETAPEAYTPKEAALEFKPIKYYEDQALYQEQEAEWKKDKDDDQAKELLDQYENGKKIVLDAELANGYHGRLTVENYDGEQSRWNRLTFEKSTKLRENFNPDMDMDSNEPKISEEEAAAKGNDVLAKLGINTMVLTNVAKTYASSGKGLKDPKAASPAEDKGKPNGYVLTYQHVYGGTAALDNRFEYSGMQKRYGPNYQPEAFSVIIRNDEIVSLDWMNPCKEVRTENKNVALKTFEEIKQAFKKQMSVTYTLGKLAVLTPENKEYEAYMANLESGSIKINRIELGMVRLEIQDHPGTYRMVPAWKFYGSKTLNEKDKTKFDDVKMPMYKLYTPALATMNAIDGSVIDTEGF